MEVYKIMDVEQILFNSRIGFWVAMSFALTLTVIMIIGIHSTNSYIWIFLLIPILFNFYMVRDTNKTISQCKDILYKR